MKVLIEMTEDQCSILQHWQADSLYKLSQTGDKLPDRATPNPPSQAMTLLTQESTRESTARLPKNPLQ